MIGESQAVRPCISVSTFLIQRYLEKEENVYQVIIFLFQLIFSCEWFFLFHSKFTFWPLTFFLVAIFKSMLKLINATLRLMKTFKAGLISVLFQNCSAAFCSLGLCAVLNQSLSFCVVICLIVCLVVVRMLLEIWLFA